MKRHRGFTLIELLIVVGILVIIAPATMKLFLDLQHRQKETEQMMDARFGADRAAHAIRQSIAGASVVVADPGVLRADEVEYRVANGWLVRSDGQRTDRLAEVKSWELEAESERLYTIVLHQSVGEMLARRDVTRRFSVARRVTGRQEVTP